jgi:putative transposase
MNAHVEAFHSILEKECYGVHEFTSVRDAYAKVDDFSCFYNDRRKHGSLGYKSPLEFYSMNQQKDAEVLGTVAYIPRSCQMVTF